MDTALANLPRDAVEHLSAFKREVEQALHGQMAGMTLFGSRARGEAEQDSDYDVAVFVRGLTDRSKVRDLVSDAAYPHLLEGIDISFVILPDDYLNSRRGRTALAEDIARDGIPLP